MPRPRPDEARAILGVAPDATGEEVTEAYRKLVREFHPDIHGGGGDRLTAVVEAYRVLRDQPVRDRPTPIPVRRHRTPGPDLRAGPVRYQPPEPGAHEVNDFANQWLAYGLLLKAATSW